MRTILLAAAIGLTATPCLAAADLTRTSDGYTYYNRPGASAAAHDSDVQYCRKKTASLYQPDTDPPTYVGGGLVGALTYAAIKAGQAAVRNHTGHMVNIENCMIVKGWRVVALEAAEGQAVAALDQKAKAAKLEAWYGAEPAHGVVVRSWNNDALSGATVMFDKAHHDHKTSLGTDAVGDEPKKPATSAGDDENKPQMARSARPPKPMKPGELGGVPADSAVILVTIKGVGQQRGLMFDRAGPNPDTPAWVDGRPASFTVAQAAKAQATAGGHQGETVAFIVPAGRWRLAGVQGGLFWTSYCLGAPAFDVAAGEVVFAGTFDPEADVQAPDMNLDHARSLLPGLSTLADKLRPAVYVNGSVGRCEGAYAYNLELPDHAFIDGYAMGSRAFGVPGAATPAQAAAPVTPAPAAAQAAAPVTPAAAPPQTAPAVKSPTGAVNR